MLSNETNPNVSPARNELRHTKHPNADCALCNNTFSSIMDALIYRIITYFMLQQKINNRESGIVVYGITPPKANHEPAKLREIAEKQLARIRKLSIDGLILYDIQDETERNSNARPFPFIETLDSLEYSNEYLSELTLPKIIYRATGKYTKTQLQQFLTQTDATEHLTVFVGAASSKAEANHLSLAQAYNTYQQVDTQMLLGGVTIPERHQAKGNEQQRVFDKIHKGCSFFVSQGVYDVNASKNFLSDYYYHSQETGQSMVPVLLTLTPCGSPQTLEFMKWLGISIPRWLENDLLHSRDILDKSIEISEQNWLELKAFADEKQIPIGVNVESVAVRKVEVDASIELLLRVQRSFE
jgi:hypothetical protein